MAAEEEPAPTRRQPVRRHSFASVGLAVVTDNMLKNAEVAEIEYEEKLQLYSLEDIRLKLKKFMSNSTFGVYYENLLLIISVASSLEYIYQSYLDYSRPDDRVVLNIINAIEKVLAVVFMFDWSLNLFMADHKLVFVAR